MARIGIYGGSFNPPHKGHFLAATQCADQLSLDRLIVIPNAIPPHKTLAENSASCAQRYRMAQLAFAADARFTVSDIELQRAGKSYTLDTLRQIKAQYPQDELFLLMGTDMFLSFNTWHAPQQIAEACTLVCMNRSDCREKMREALSAQAQSYAESYNAKCAFVQNAFIDISSTDVRRLLRFGCAEEFLQPEVADYILKNRLYDTADDWKGLPFAALREKSLSLHKDARKAHAVGCSELSAELARRYGLSEETARRAGILHDVTKALSPNAQYAMCRHYHVTLSAQEQENPKLMHAITGALAAQTLFGESEEVCMAIRWHTTGHRGMTMMEKILYIADYAEPNRDFPGVELLREALQRNLDEAVLLGIQMTIEQLKEKNQPICDNTLGAYLSISGERI